MLPTVTLGGTYGTEYGAFGMRYQPSFISQICAQMQPLGLRCGIVRTLIGVTPSQLIHGQCAIG